MWLPHINEGVTVARARVYTPDPTFISRGTAEPIALKFVT